MSVRAYYIAAVFVLGITLLCSCGGDTTEPPLTDNSLLFPKTKPGDVLSDKMFFDETAKEFVGLFKAEDAAPYASIYKAVKGSDPGEAGERVLDIIEGLTTKTESANLTVYKYAIKASAFKGRYVLTNGRWDMVSSEGHSAVFYDDEGRRCKLTVTMSGPTKNVTIREGQRIYEVELPAHIECVLTQADSRLVKIVADIELSDIDTGQMITLIANSMTFRCTADFKGVAKITTDALCQVQGESTVNIVVEKGGRTILTADASSTGSIAAAMVGSAYNEDVFGKNETYLNLNILDKIQAKGYSDNINALVKELDKAGRHRNRYKYNAVSQCVDMANSYMEANVYYNNGTKARASLRFDVDYKEHHYFKSNDNWKDRIRYYPVTSVCFPDGSSYFLVNYFTEDTFKSLFELFGAGEDEEEDNELD